MKHLEYKDTNNKVFIFKTVIQSYFCHVSAPLRFPRIISVLRNGCLWATEIIVGEFFHQPGQQDQADQVWHGHEDIGHVSDIPYQVHQAA